MSVGHALGVVSCATGQVVGLNDLLLSWSLGSILYLQDLCKSLVSVAFYPAHESSNRIELLQSPQCPI